MSPQLRGKFWNMFSGQKENPHAAKVWGREGVFIIWFKPHRINQEKAEQWLKGVMDDGPGGVVERMMSRYLGQLPMNPF